MPEDSPLPDVKPDVWHNFYEKQREIRDHYSTYGGGDLPVPMFNPDPKDMFDEYHSTSLKSCDKLFTSEESRGRFLDLNHLYHKY